MEENNANDGQLSDKSKLTASTHALNVPGHRGKSQLRELDIVARYCIAQEGQQWTHQSRIAFGRIVARYC